MKKLAQSEHLLNNYGQKTGQKQPKMAKNHLVKFGPYKIPPSGLCWVSMEAY